MSIEQKLKELQELAEQLDVNEAKKCMKEEEPEDKEDEPEGEDSGSEIENDEGNGKEKVMEKKKSMKESDDEEEDDSEEEVMEKKKSMKESKIDLGDLFSGQELSEEFKQKATAVFEAAVAVRVKQEVAALKESFEQQGLQESVELKESLVDKVDGYLDYMVEQWMSKNELAINRGIKTEILESFVSGMKSLFESHYIDVPDEKYDLVEATQGEVQTLESKLDEQAEVIINLQRQIKQMNREALIAEACKELADTDAEKFRGLAEELTFSNEEEFGGKLTAILENYFPATTPAKKVLSEEFMTDEPVKEEILEAAKVETVDPLMKQYLKAIEKTGF